jgi:hypothetical protein
MSLSSERTIENAPLDLQSILSNPANLIFFNELMDQRIKEAKEEERRLGCRTGTSIDASELLSTDSPLTSSSQSSSASSSSSSANECNKALKINKSELSEWSDITLRDVYSAINKPNRYSLIAALETVQSTELIEIR